MKSVLHFPYRVCLEQCEWVFRFVVKGRAEGIEEARFTIDATGHGIRCSTNAHTDGRHALARGARGNFRGHTVQYV
jgi:hypothetical protein